MIYRSESMQSVVATVDRIAPTDIVVLVRGESGVGKELVARRIHASSGREGPFLKVNCGALPPDLLESEMFGSTPGAYTDAAMRPGRFLAAAGGTLLLDEVADLPLRAQAALLQVLQEGRFTPVGGERDLGVDVRVVAATNRDLGEAVSRGLFRRDLYYRLNVLPIRVPPLRHRPEDVPLLLQEFVTRYARDFGRPVPRLSRATLATLMFYPWPGNVRELDNFAQRAVLQGDAEEVAAELERSPMPQEMPESTVVDEALAALRRGEPVQLKDVSRAAALEVERRVLAKVLERTRWNRRRAAELVHISYRALLYKVKDLGLEPAG